MGGWVVVWAVGWVVVWAVGWVVVWCMSGWAGRRAGGQAGGWSFHRSSDGRPGGWVDQVCGSFPCFQRSKRHQAGREACMRLRCSSDSIATGAWVLGKAGEALSRPAALPPDCGQAWLPLLAVHPPSHIKPTQLLPPRTAPSPGPQRARRGGARRWWCSRPAPRPPSIPASPACPARSRCEASGKRLAEELGTSGAYWNASLKPT